jgi:CSLREA domain-containing protein
MRRLICLLLLSVVFLATFAFPSYATISSYTFNVNTFTDSVDTNPGDGICDNGSGACSLRAAIMEANALSPANVTINVPAGTYNLTITYGAEEDASASNDLDITNSGSTIITGVGTGQDVIINAFTIAHRVFDVISGGNLSLNNLTITKGYSSVGGGGIRVASGGILNLNYVIITENESVYGAGIYNAGTITGTMVSITSNVVSGSGSCGGGIYLAGSTNNSITLTRSLISGNSASQGGGICNWGNGSYSSPVGGNLRLENVTVGGNTAAEGCGGGIVLTTGSSSYFINCTIANNICSASTSGAGVCGNGANAFDFLNTLVFNNTGYGGVNNCYQVKQSSSEIWSGLNSAYFDKNVPFGYNMNDDSPSDAFYDCFTNVVSNLLEASLTTSSALASVGTYKLQTGSAAIDAGDPANYPSVDVFGTTRPQGTAPDIGAYEFVEDLNAPPSIPVLTSPANGTNLFGTGIRLFWQKSSDPEGGNVTYRLQVAEDTGFTINLQTFEVNENGTLIAGVGMAFPVFALLGLLGWQRRKQTLIGLTAAILLATTLLIGCGSGGGASNSGINGNTVSFEVTGLDSGKTYYWRVIAVDAQDKESDPSETWSFTTG